jgi:hypothetical protein
MAQAPILALRWVTKLCPVIKTRLTWFYSTMYKDEDRRRRSFLVGSAK